MANDKIKRQDIFADDIFDNKQLEAYKTSIEATIIATDQLIHSNIILAESRPFDSAKDLKEFNKAVSQGTTAINAKAKAEKELVAIQIKEQQLLQQKIKSQREEFKNELLLEKAIRDETKAREKANAEIKKTSDLFSQNKKKLKELTSELLNLKPGTQRFKEVAAEAGKIKDELNDAKDAVKAFANESKAATAKNLFGQVFRDIADLDFKGAADKAKILKEVMSSITFKEAADSVKNLGSSLFDLAKSIVLSPFFAIGAAIAGVAASVYVLYQNYKFASEAADEFNKSLAVQDQRIKEISESTENLKLQNDVLAGKITQKDADLLKRKNEFKKKYIEILKAQREGEAAINKKFDDQALKEVGAFGVFGPGGGNIAQNEIERARELLESKKKTGEELKALQQNFGQEIRGIILKEEKATTKVVVEETKKRTEEVKKVKQQEVESLTKVDLLNQVRDIDSELDASIKKLKIRQAEEDAKKRMAAESAALRKAARKKEIQEEIENALKVLDAIESGLDQRNEREREASDFQIEETRRSIDEQFRLAAEGKANTLAFERAELNKLDLARKDALKKQQRQEEAIRLSETFLSDLNAKLAKDIPFGQAISEAIAETFAAKGISQLIAGSAFEGTEDTGGRGNVDSKGGKLWVLHPNERVVKAEDNKLLEGMSNDELVRRALLPDYSLGSVPAQGVAENMASSMAFQQFNKYLPYLEKIANKPETSLQIDNLGQVVRTEVSNGIKTRFKYLKPTTAGLR